MDTYLFLVSIFRSRYIFVSLCLWAEDMNFTWLFSPFVQARLWVEFNGGDKFWKSSSWWKHLWFIVRKAAGNSTMLFICVTVVCMVYKKWGYFYLLQEILDGVGENNDQQDKMILHIEQEFGCVQKKCWAGF